MKQRLVAALLLGTAVIFSCAKKAAPTKTEAVKVPAITYSGEVKALVQAKCTPCHIPAEGGRKTALDSYAAVKGSIDEMLRRVQLASGARGYMPFKKEPLSEAEITLLKNWKASGSPE